MASEGDDIVAEEPPAKRARVASVTDVEDRKFEFVQSEFRRVGLTKFTFRLSSTAVVESAKEKISEQFGLHIENIHLIRHEFEVHQPMDSKIDRRLLRPYTSSRTLLKDGQQIWQDDSVEGDTIDVFVKLNEPTIQICIKTLTGATMAFRVNPKDSVKWLKFLIFAGQGIPMDPMRIIFNGVQFEDGRSLESYSVTNGDEILIICSR